MQTPALHRPVAVRCAVWATAGLLMTSSAARAQGHEGATWPSPTALLAEQAHAKLMSAPQVQAVLAALKADDARSLADLKALTEIPAPPFKEHARAEAFRARLLLLGLTDAKIDAEGNVVGLRKGTGGGPLLVVSAHLDTVFPEGTDVTVSERDGRLHAPGISDDTRGLVVLLSWLKALNEGALQTVGDLLFVGDVGEEELGNLRGIKAVFSAWPQIDGMVALEPGEGDAVIVHGTGSRRWEVNFHGPGGHSYAAFGQPSAVHAMGRAIARIADVRTPETPRTTFTVGTASGGTAVNAIAGDARMTIDIRSDAAPQLQETERKIMAAIEAGVADENQRWNSDRLSADSRLIGDRPAGRTSGDSIIVQAAKRSISASGRTPVMASASTDANWPMSLGVPAIVLGSGGKTGGFHALNEWFDARGAWEGSQLGLTTVLALVGVQGVSEPLLPKRVTR